MIIKERIVYDMVASDSYYRGEALKGNALMEISEESKEAVRDLFLGGMSDLQAVINCFLGECTQVIDEEEGFLVVNVRVKVPVLWPVTLCDALSAAMYDYLAESVARRWLEKFGVVVAERDVTTKLRALMNRRRMPDVQDYKGIKIIEI